MRDRSAAADEGAVLILALIFVAVVGLVGGAIALFASSSLAQTSGLQQDRAQQFAAESALQVAIQAVREMPGAGGNVQNAPGYNGTACPDTQVPVPEAGITEAFTVKCVVGKAPLPFERTITFAACPSAANCLTGQQTYTPTPGSSAIAVATVTYYDLDTGYSFATGTTNGSGGWNVGNAIDVTLWDLTKANA